MAEFFEAFRVEEYPELAKFLENRFPGREISSLNLEEVITHLELSLEGFGAKWKRMEFDLYQAHYNCMEYIEKRLNYIPKPEMHSEIHRKIISQCSPNDTFITLNYDLILDLSLYGYINKKMDFDGQKYLTKLDHIVGSPIHLAGSSPSKLIGEWKGFFLKLHGSLGWFYCPEEKCNNHQQFSLTPPFGGSEEVDQNDSCRICGSAMAPVIVPSVSGKSFEKYPKMGILWNVAYREIRDATKLIFIGLSLPESDYFFWWLLREGRTESSSIPEVIVVNKFEAERVKVDRLLGVKSGWKGDIGNFAGSLGT
jgi:hypothetical protein